MESQRMVRQLMVTMTSPTVENMPYIDHSRLTWEGGSAAPLASVFKACQIGKGVFGAVYRAHLKHVLMWLYIGAVDCGVHISPTCVGASEYSIFLWYSERCGLSWIRD